MDKEDPPGQRPQRPYFRLHKVPTTLSNDALDRQTKAARLAIEAFGLADGIAFLNKHDDALEGRPIDLALASAEGLAKVEASLKAGAGNP